jgi:hypothetical protein
MFVSIVNPALKTDFYNDLPTEELLFFNNRFAGSGQQAFPFAIQIAMLIADNRPPFPSMALLNLPTKLKKQSVIIDVQLTLVNN